MIAPVPYNCRCRSLCGSVCECSDCDARKLYSVTTDVEEAVKEVLQGKEFIEKLLQSRSDHKAQGVLCDLYLTSSWGWRGLADKPFAALEAAFETLDRFDMQFADDHFESDIGGSQGYYNYGGIFSYDMDFSWDDYEGSSWDVSSWDRVDRCQTWGMVRFGLFSDSIYGD